MHELSKFLYSVWLLRVLCVGYYYHKTSTAVYPVPRYFFTVNTVDEILSTAHPYCLVYSYYLLFISIGQFTLQYSECKMKTIGLVHH